MTTNTIHPVEHRMINNKGHKNGSTFNEQLNEDGKQISICVYRHWWSKRRLVSEIRPLSSIKCLKKPMPCNKVHGHLSTKDSFHGSASTDAMNVLEL